MQSAIAFLMDRPPVDGPGAVQLGGQAAQQAGGNLAGPMGRMMHGGHPGGFFLGGLFGGLITAVWAALIVLLVLWIVRNWSNPNNPIIAFGRRAASALQPSSTAAPVTQTPLEIVQARYAKGEINREEYETIRRDLTGEAPSAPATPVPPVEPPAVQA